MDFRWDVITNNLDLFLSGARLTVWIAAVSFTLSVLLGVLVAVLRMSRNRVVYILMAGYINIFRSIPVLVAILFAYYGISIAFGLGLSAIQAGILALVLQYSAWLGETFRAGIQAVPHGHREAALSAGMSRIQTFFTVVLPQAFRIVVPPTGNWLVGTIKDSSLVYLIGVPELMRVTNQLANRTFRYFEVYFAALVIYLILTTVVYYLTKYTERRFEPVDVLNSHRRVWSIFGLRKRKRLLALRNKVAGGISETGGVPSAV